MHSSVSGCVSNVLNWCDRLWFGVCIEFNVENGKIPYIRWRKSEWERGTEIIRRKIRYRLNDVAYKVTSEPGELKWRAALTKQKPKEQNMTKKETRWKIYWIKPKPTFEKKHCTKCEAVRLCIVCGKWSKRNNNNNNCVYSCKWYWEKKS